MAVHLRLRRMGKKKQPFYRIVAIDSRVARDGKYIENLGTYNPRTHPSTVTLDRERALYWLSVGAKPSDTVRNILSKRGVLLFWHLKKRGLDEEKINEAMREWEAAQTERQKRQEALQAQKKREQKVQAEAKAEAETEPESEPESDSKTESQAQTEEASESEESKE